MATTLRFVGGPRFKDGHAYATPPLAGPFKTRQRIDQLSGKPAKDEEGNPILEQIVGWEVGDQVTFDRSLAESYGRLGSDPKDDGDEWAQFFLGTWNANYPKGEEPFEVVAKAKSKTPTDESVSVTGGTPPVAVDAAGDK